MRTNHVKARLRRGDPVYGMWLNLPCLASARLLAHAGFDWLAIDAEHAPQRPDLLGEMVAAIAAAPGCAPLVRLPAHRIEWYKWALDAGAWGVIVPMVNSRIEAEQAVHWSRYPPEGTRSIGGAFAHYAFGAADARIYAANVNAEILVAVQIESVEALTALDDILSVPGLDVAFVGPNDLHASLGLTPASESAEPAFLAALEQIKAAAERHNLATGIYCSDGAAAARRVREGFQMVAAGGDVGALGRAAREALTIMREIA